MLLFVAAVLVWYAITLVVVSDIVINSHTHQKEIRKPLSFLLNCLLLDHCHLIVHIQQMFNHLSGYYTTTLI